MEPRRSCSFPFDRFPDQWFWSGPAGVFIDDRSQLATRFLTSPNGILFEVDGWHVPLKWTDMNSNHERVLDQFTRQALPFASAPSIRNREALDRIVRMAEAGPRDVVLDVACGPGLLVCAFATVVEHATGIDLTPAMLEQARREQQQQGLDNITWLQGDVLPLPFSDETFSIVTARFAFHHFPNPLAVLLEMRRVCKMAGCILVADTAPAEDKAANLNAMERLRDPSHVRAMPVA